MEGAELVGPDGGCRQGGEEQEGRVDAETRRRREPPVGPAISASHVPVSVSLLMLRDISCISFRCRMGMDRCARLCRC